MAPTMKSITDKGALSLQAELGTTCGLVSPWVWLVGGIVTVVSDGGAGGSGVIGGSGGMAGETATGPGAGS